MSVGDNVDKALGECGAALVDGLGAYAPPPAYDPTRPYDGIVGAFVQLFKDDFTTVLGPTGTGDWSRDRAKITALARAIGALAQFIAIQRKHRVASDADIHDAYMDLKPCCLRRDRETMLGPVKGQYCPTVN